MKPSNHSFCIPAYHDSPFIEECIKSLMNQTVRSEILISTSTPSAFLQDLSDKYKIKLLINNTMDGIASDWSFAYNSAETEFVTLAHQDDIYLPQYTELSLYAMMNQPDSFIAFSDYQEIRETHVRNLTLNILVKMIMFRFFFPLKHTLHSNVLKRLMLSFGNPVSCPGVMYNKRNIGMFDFNKEFDINLDWDAWLNLAGQKGSFVYIKKRLFIHRIHEDAESMKSISDQRRFREDKMMLEKIWPKGIYQILSAFYSLSRRGW